MLGNFIFFYSGSSVTLSPWRSGESCRSKDQRKDPLTGSTEVNQTKRGIDRNGTSGSFRDPVEIGFKLFRKERIKERKDRN